MKHKSVLTILKLVALAAVMAVSYLAGNLTSPAWTQGTISQYVQVDYMKVEPGKLQSYLELEQLWKPVHEELVKAGKKKSWALYGVAFAGAKDEYNYLTVNVFDRFEDIEDQYPPEFFKRAHPDKDPEAINQKTVETRTMVYSDVWILIDEVGMVPLKTSATE
jgi:hypothetical protein